MLSTNSFGFNSRPFERFSSNMHWQTYTYNGPLTPEMEQTFRREASRALSQKHGAGPLGFSVATSFTTINGHTTGTTEFQVGKGSHWTHEERAILDEKFAKLVPNGMMNGPDGRPLIMGAREHPRITPIEDSPRPKAIEPAPPVHKNYADADQKSHSHSGRAQGGKSRRSQAPTPSVPSQSYYAPSASSHHPAVATPHASNHRADSLPSTPAQVQASYSQSTRARDHHHPRSQTQTQRSYKKSAPVSHHSQSQPYAPQLSESHHHAQPYYFTSHAQPSGTYSQPHEHHTHTTAPIQPGHGTEHPHAHFTPSTTGGQGYAGEMPISPTYAISRDAPGEGHKRTSSLKMLASKFRLKKTTAA
ncbi:uncharacterized protein L203_104201 [Cryptococcus depauperatus CBS 7841]|uniref:Uncharacterized protein n=1 Tax=Cryptococcus depauperatus CBS 7841 TaxID=1295531 RepID=A0A1E3I606_9TREE|nr:hypothetical protein L203_05203 [Cryptococcus depauperatus CBS 7841]